MCVYVVSSISISLSSFSAFHHHHRCILPVAAATTVTTVGTWLSGLFAVTSFGQHHHLSAPWNSQPTESSARRRSFFFLLNGPKLGATHTDRENKTNFVVLRSTWRFHQVACRRKTTAKREDFDRKSPTIFLSKLRRRANVFFKKQKIKQDMWSS